MLISEHVYPPEYDLSLPSLRWRMGQADRGGAGPLREMQIAILERRTRQSLAGKAGEYKGKEDDEMKKTELIGMILALASAPLVAAQVQDVAGWNDIKWGGLWLTKAVLGNQAVPPTETPSVNFVLIDKLIIVRLVIEDVSCKAHIQTKRNSDSIIAVTVGMQSVEDPPETRGYDFDLFKRLLIEKIWRA